MGRVEMQTGMIAVYVDTERVPEYLGQFGCDAARIDAVGFAVVAQCASAAKEAEMAWQLVRLPDGVVETLTERVYELPGQKGFDLALWESFFDDGTTL